ncbi:uncharacterized protein B0I36DRAFT_11885 [Microdochium trichocladiopsis]|uniref:MARVEL domain-containing protein n=1 Tax=Microdochium trichocladiopsis TaxID=1682393 RepID=A0A9P8YJG3_9PEZI|nr:uncharacterized protein B0I36DRAFT_11885 [Microdochium trichocladiopsis]KAH7040531.1 hypothetical protein B0I36DRAFT_11885 [Microdochium trichocladiopsis]
MIVLSFLFLALRSAQLVFALIVLGISGHISASWATVTSGSSKLSTVVPSEVTWMIICSIIALISVIYLELAPKFLPSVSHPYASITLETTNSMFLLAGSIALAAFLNKLSPAASSTCPFSSSTPGAGTPWSGHCINIAAAAAAAALGIIASLLWAASAFLTVNDMFKLKQTRINLTRKLSVFSVNKETIGKHETV